jgi:hypothetical protein
MIKNYSNEKIAVRWNNELYYNGKCANCDNKEGMLQTILLEANENKTGDCSISCLPQLKLFVKMIELPNNQTLSDFKLKDIITYSLRSEKY